MKLTSEQIVILRNASRIMEEAAAAYDTHVFKVDSCPELKKYALALLVGEEREHFVCLYLDTQHNLITRETLFLGTIDAASIYAREVVKGALKHNAGAVVFIHNHPSGLPEPSMADRAITQRLKDVLEVVDVRVLDHIVVGSLEHGAVSFAERNIL